MSFIQLTASKPVRPFVSPCKPTLDIASKCHLPCPLSRQLTVLPSSGGFQLNKASLKLETRLLAVRAGRLPKVITRACRSQQSSPVCLFGGKGKSENGNEASPWKAIEKAMGNLTNQKSVEDVLRQQIEKQEFYDDGGSGGNRPGGGGGGEGTGDSDEGLSGILDELVQVILASVGFIFLYILIIEGEDIIALGKDMIKFLFSGYKSIRLKRTLYEWGRLYQRLTKKKKIEPYWLERAILNTPTWWDSPERYKRILMAYLQSSSDEESQIGDDFE